MIFTQCALIPSKTTSSSSSIMSATNLSTRPQVHLKPWSLIAHLQLITQAPSLHCWHLHLHFNLEKVREARYKQAPVGLLALAVQSDSPREEPGAIFFKRCNTRLAVWFGRSWLSDWAEAGWWGAGGGLRYNRTISWDYTTQGTWDRINNIELQGGGKSSKKKGKTV